MLSIEEVRSYTRGCSTTIGHGMSCSAGFLCGSCEKISELVEKYTELEQKNNQLKKRWEKLREGIKRDLGVTKHTSYSALDFDRYLNRLEKEEAISKLSVKGI